MTSSYGENQSDIECSLPVLHCNINFDTEEDDYKEHGYLAQIKSRFYVEAYIDMLEIPVIKTVVPITRRKFAMYQKAIAC